MLNHFFQKHSLLFSSKIFAGEVFEYMTSGKVLIVSLTLGFLGDSVSKYIFSDWEFLVYLVVAMVLDTAVGLVKAWRDERISKSGYSQFLVKIIVYFSVLILSHVLTNLLIHGENTGLFTWVEKVFFMALILREAISIIRNVALIYPGLIPTSVLRRLEDFDENGEKKETP